MQAYITTKDNELAFAFTMSLDDLTYLHADLLKLVLHRLSTASSISDKAAAVNSLVQMIDEGRKGKRKMTVAAIFKICEVELSKLGKTP